MSTASGQPELPLAFALPAMLGPYRAADYEKLPEGEPVELIHGEYVVSPAPNTHHQMIVGLLYEIILRASRNSGGFGVMSPVDVVLSDASIVQPDLVYVANNRRHIVRNRIEGPPDLAIEIISQSHAARDRVHKLALYAEHGVAEYWIVDPAEKVIEFLLLKGDRYQVEPLTSDSYTSPRLPEVSIDLPAFWADVDRLMNG
jgi:Uma2 family endonuclease